MDLHNVILLYPIDITMCTMCFRTTIEAGTMLVTAPTSDLVTTKASSIGWYVCICVVIV